MHISLGLIVCLPLAMYTFEAQKTPKRECWLVCTLAVVRNACVEKRGLLMKMDDFGVFLSFKFMDCVRVCWSTNTKNQDRSNILGLTMASIQNLFPYEFSTHTKDANSLLAGNKHWQWTEIDMDLKRCTQYVIVIVISNETECPIHPHLTYTLTNTEWRNAVSERKTCTIQRIQHKESLMHTMHKPKENC